MCVYECCICVCMSAVCEGIYMHVGDYSDVFV